MENMRAILVDTDALFFFAINIAAQVSAPVKHQTALTALLRFMGKHTAKEAASHNEIIVFHPIAS